MEISSVEYKVLANDPTSNWFCSNCKTSDCCNVTEAIQKIRQESEDTRKTSSEVILPVYDEGSSSIHEATWGSLKGEDIIKSVNLAYSKIVKWRKNLFKVPTGKVGQEFIEEVTKVLSFFVSGSHFESIALTMVMIIFPLAERLVLWKSGDISTLLRQGTKIQDRLKAPKADERHHEKVFCRLMLQGKVSAALRWISSQKSGVLDINEDVIGCLKEKHPVADKIDDQALLKGPVETFDDVILDSIDGELIHKTAKTINGAAGPSGADAEIWKQILC